MSGSLLVIVRHTLGAVVMSRAGAFEQLRRNLELTGLQQSTVAARQGVLRAALAGDLTVRDSFLTGSYVRQTLIGPLARADVDIVVVLDARTYAGRGARGVLDMVRRVLLRTFPGTPEISRSGQAVTVSFRNFAIDVVPAFEQWHWWQGDGYRICDSGSDGWIFTNPKKHAEISSKANRFNQGALVPCIKQLKAWNRTVNSPLRSFHIEVLAWEIFDTLWWWPSQMGCDWENVRYFFDKARGRIPGRQPDPAGTGKDVGAYLSGQAIGDAVSKATTAYERCVRAERQASAGRLGAAHEAYRRVFGSYYPAA